MAAAELEVQEREAVRYAITQGPAWSFLVPDGLDRFAIIREPMKKFARAMGISFFDVDIEDHGS